MRTTILFLPLVAVLLAATAVPAATPDANSDRLISEALKPSPIENNLRVLTDAIGGRVPGTPAMGKAVQWGVDAFKAAGADSVHVEEFSIPSSWAEGATEMT